MDAKPSRLAALLLLLLLSVAQLSPWLWAQAPATEAPATRRTSPPFTGDPSRFERRDRARKLQADRVMDLLGIRPGAGVADIGAGSGWFTMLAAKRVTAAGKVYAVDINAAFVRDIRARAQREGFRNIEAILGRPDDPMLPANSLDSVLLLKTYHEVARPVDLLKNLRAALRPGARVGVIDRNGKGHDHGVDAAVVVDEARQAGYELLEQHDFVKEDDGVDYFLVFRAVGPQDPLDL